MIVKKLCILFLGGCLWGGGGVAARSPLRVSPATVQLGEVPLRSKNRIELTCVNVSDRPLVIREVRTDCTCTKPAWSKAPLMPGDSVRVSVVLTPTDRGAFYKTLRFVTVPTTDDEPVQVVLRGKVY